VAGERRGQVVRLARAEQAVVRDPAGWERRILSPALPGVEFEFMRTTLGPGVDAGTFDPHPPGSREYAAVESGELELTVGGTGYRLGTGDALYYEGDCDHGFRNRLAWPCVYYLVMDAGSRAGVGHG
jgi:quercetin dioxygenase-like cupin family protein